MDLQKIGKFIYELRIERGLSQYKLAEMIPISRQAVSKWETGKAMPDSSTLLVLSKIFDVSIDELLYGRRITKNDYKTDIQNSITLNVVDDINKKSRKIKKLRISILITIVVFMITFLFYYFINSYNSIKVFIINGETDNFATMNGIFVTTRDKIYFRLGNFDNKENVEIDEFELYYLENGEEKKVFSSDTANLLIRDYYGYNEYFYYDNLSEFINNLYLRIYFNNTYEDIHLGLEQDFANNKLFFLKHKPISSKDNNQDIPVSSLNNNIIIDTKNMDCIDEICTLIIEDEEKNITYTYIKGSGFLNIIERNSSKTIEWNYFVDNNILVYNVYENNEIIETINIDVNDINNEYINYVQQFRNEYITKHLY